MDRLGLGSFPGFVLERGAELIGVPHGGFYGPPTAFADAVAEAAKHGAA